MRTVFSAAARMIPSRLQNSSKRETGRFLKKAPQKLLKWFYLDIVTAIPCATKYRNCKTLE
ncbi:MAG: hypothetical protein IJB52_11530, partial [Clostridia bacterium]|nr:hypothetical protein [Clostridia bacterium]